MSVEFDVFMSYAHADSDRVKVLVNALRTRGLRVWIDKSEGRDFESITRTITNGLANAKALLAFYSSVYPSRRACQWELTAAFLAGQHEGDPRRRVLVVNPETRLEHIYPVELRDALFRSLRDGAGAAEFSSVADAVHAAVQNLPTGLSQVRPMAAPPWHGTKGLGSNRFVGRVRTFWQVHSALFANDAAVITAQAAPGHAQVHGMGGIGKSLLAEEYALRYGAAYPGGIFVLKATSDRDDQLAAFAARLGGGSEAKNPHEVEGFLQRRLRGAGEPYLWLVDDLPVGAGEAERRSWFAPNSLGKTLITTRSREHASTGAVISLGVLDAEEGYALLTARRKPSVREEAAARSIVEALGFHPLAIDVAGGVLLKLGSEETFDGFLAKLRAPSGDALAAAAALHPDLPNGHDASIATTLLTSIQLVDDAGRDFLRLASVLATDVIPYDLIAAVFSALGNDSPWAARSATDAAVSHCLAEPSDEGKGYSVHALVCHTMRAYDPDAGRRDQLRELAIDSLGRVLCADTRADEVFSAHFAHARYLAADPDTVSEAALLELVGNHDCARGYYQLARANHEAVLAARRRLLSPDDPITFIGLTNLADALSALGDLSGARDCQEAALTALCVALGEDNQFTLAARNNLANTLLSQGDLQEARGHQERVWEELRRSPGEEHARTLIARLNLAETLSKQGDLGVAQTHQEAVLEASRRSLGEESAVTLAARLKLAGTLRKQGDLSGARAHQKAVFEANGRLLGEENPETLRARGALATTMCEQGELSAARAHLEVVFETTRRLWGEGNPDTLVARLNLAGVLSAQRDLSGARTHEEAVWEARRRTSGETHSSTLNARSNLAATLFHQGDLHAARGHQEAVWDASRRLFPEDHPDTLSARNNLAFTLFKQGDLSGARAHQEAVLEARRRVLGEEHPHTLAALDNLVATLISQRDLSGTRFVQEAVLEARRSKLGEEHRHTLTLRKQLAQTLLAQDDLATAREHQEALWGTARRLHGETHRDTLIARNDLAATIFAQGDLASAREHQEAVFVASQHSLGEEHPHTIVARMNLATTMLEQGDLAGAREHRNAMLRLTARKAARHR